MTQKDDLIAKRNSLATLVKEAKNNGEDASRFIAQMGSIGDKLKEIDQYGE